jgi:phenylpropionate dioxygenase-like ring-hydroxylating dioxygenase large terminal subunit
VAVQQRELEDIGPILSDGTRLIDLIDVERREVSLRLFADPEVWRAEQRLLFGRMWNLMGHESEIPEVGDFVRRQIANESVIMSRGRDGEIHVMLNACTHRGVQVCRTDCGSQANFKCPYHGWIFSPEGSLLGAPFEREMYGDSLDKENLGLRQARVESYAGLVFANWDRGAPPLDEFLGEYTWYLDTVFKRSIRGLEAYGAPQRYRLKANWKITSEQFNGADGYHAGTLHRSLFEMLGEAMGEDAVNMAQRASLYGTDIGSPLGHGLRCIAGFRNPTDDDPASFADPLDYLKKHPPPSYTPEMVAEFREHLTDGQLRALTTYPPSVGGIFPNAAFSGTLLQVHLPLAFDTIEMLHIQLVEKDASPQVKAEVAKNFIGSLGASGTVEQDDAESWPSIQRVSQGHIGSQEAMRYSAFVGHNPPEGWEGPGYVYNGPSADDSAWNFWLHYRHYMSGASV